MVIRKAVALTSLMFGFLLALVAYAKLYNIDEQPRSLLGAYALEGGLRVAVGLVLWFSRPATV